MNIIDLLSTLPSFLLLITNELIKESARTGKTPAQLLEEAGLKTDVNEEKAIELLAKLKGQ